ncbi:MAG: hypothetical protein SFV24_06335 [Gemmatimonadales bacterium]|nr:hypothetical protein [Gemmatimonadales bacterium]
MRTPLVVAALLLTLPALAPAQATPTETEAVLTMAKDQRREVRLTAERARIIGRIVALNEGAATIEGAAGSRTIRIAGIDTVWTRGHHTRTGAILGGAAGAIAGGMLGYIVAAVCDAAECRSTTEGALIGGAIGIPFGMFSGALVGSLFPRWQRRVP